MSQATLNSAIPYAITRKLRLVRSRKKWMHVANALVAAAAVLLAAMLVAMLIDWLATLYDSRWRYVLTNAALSAAAVTVVGWLIVAWRRGLAWDRVAGDVDQEFPQLEERWTTMTRLEPDAVGNPALVHPAMFRRVASEAERWEPHVDPEQIVSLSLLIRTMLCLTAITLVLAVAVVLDSHQTIVLVKRFWWPGASISATELVNLPGSTVVGRGEPLLLEASVHGTPAERATLFLKTDKEERAIKLVARGSHQLAFSHNVRSVDEPFAYRFRAGDGQTEWFNVGVADRPEIGELSMTITPPAYTGRTAKTFDKLPRRISTLANSALELAVRPTIAVEKVELQLRNQEFVPLAADADGWYRWSTTLKENLSFAPLLTESQGLTNRHTTECEINVVADKPPAVKVITPDDQMAVRPEDKVEITFAAQDDVGIGSAELVVYSADSSDGNLDPLTTIPIPLDDQEGARSVQGKVELDLSQFSVTDGNELSYEIRVREDRGKPEAAQADAPAVAISARPAAETPSPEGAAPGEMPRSGGEETENSQPPAASPSPPAESLAANEETPPSASPTATPPGVGSNPLTDANSTPPGPEPSPTDTATIANNDRQAPASDNTATSPGRTATSDRRGLASADTPPTAPPNSANPQTPSAPGANSPQMAANQPQSNVSNQPAGSNQSGSSASQPSASQMASNQTGQSSPSDPPPGDSMTRRTLDVGQSASSQRMRLKVDQWAGSFSGQQRRKTEMAIGPKLEALDEALAKAQRIAAGVLDSVAAEREWRPGHDREVTSAEQATVSGQKLIKELQEKSEETPYAFVGLQVADIGLAHVDLARTGFWTALQSDGDDRVTSVRDAWQHLGRARKLIAELQGQFDRARREFQLAESVERVKKMYQVYVENSMALLPTQPNDPTRYGRKMAEFELDDEYMARLREVLMMREELRAELARILADDPRLLRRLMDSIRNRSQNLREELAALVADQKELNREVRAWTAAEDSDQPRMAQLLLLRQLRKAGEISAVTGELQDRYQAWLPLKHESKEANLASATENVQQLTSAANELDAHTQAFIAEATRPKVIAPPIDAAATTPATATQEAPPAADITPIAPAAPSLDALIAEGQRVYELGLAAEVTLRQLSAEGNDPQIASFATNRLAESRRVIAETSAWVRQVRAHQAGKYSRAAEVDQYRLAMKTDELAGKLGSIEQTLAGLMERQDGSLPGPIAAKAREFLATLDKEASPNQLAAVYALHTDDLIRTVGRQKSAEQALVKAEKLYDEMMKLAIEEMDKLPVQDPIANLLNDPTLDELLAELEQELPLQELLGVPPRPSNLQIVNDWMRPSDGGISSGGAAWLQQYMRYDNRRARQRLDDAYRRAIARALKEQTAGRKIERPRPTKLSDWNRLVSRLGDDLGQGRDKAPPEQYRRAIEQYFAQISREVAEAESEQKSE